MTSTTIREFYNEIFKEKSCPELDYFFQEQLGSDIGHFNVFDIGNMYKSCGSKPAMPYNRRTYYKISLIKGRNTVEYADKFFEVNDYAVLFATPKIPYRYTPLDLDQEGHFCVFTQDFMTKSQSGLYIDDLPIYKNGNFVLQINQQQFEDIERIFKKMHDEVSSDYAFKYDLIRNYVMELVHYGQKLQPVVEIENKLNASTRISSLFVELLERQFPIESPEHNIALRSAKDYADTLKIHVNHLNKVLKEVTGKTTTEIIASRVTQEAKVLLKKTTWNVSEIAYSLGFEEVAHFSNFFKKQTELSPMEFRNH